MKTITLFLLFTASFFYAQDHQDRSRSGSLNAVQKIVDSPNLVSMKNHEIEKVEKDVFELDIAKNIPKTLQIDNYSIGVVIGNKEYFNKRVPNVDFAINDAKLVKQYLLDAFGYKSENIIYLENASQAELNLVFGTTNNYKGKLFDYVIPNKSEIFIYYSGHGAPNTDDSQAFLVPSDCDPDKVALNGYSLETLYNNLDKLADEKKVKHTTIVLDACFSGNSQKGSILSNISPIEIKVKNNLMLSQNKTIFTSTSENQVSTWYEEKGLSLFTYFFLKGLNGSADLNGDKIITSEELNDFTSNVSDGVPYWSRRLNSRTQIPQIIGTKNYQILNYNR